LVDGWLNRWHRFGRDYHRNTLTGNADSGIAAVGMTAGAGLNLIANNTLTNRRRCPFALTEAHGTHALWCLTLH
jgi:hypothetical protein